MCTRVFWSDNKVAKVASRTMDWSFSDDAELWVFPRGITRVGGAGEASAEWTSIYGSVSVTAWGRGTSDATNDQGLGVHGLFLAETAYEAPDDRPVLANVRWVQWIVDNFATVAEVVAGIDQVRIASIDIKGQDLGVHLAVEDASGDSAIIEVINGAKVVHHGHDTTVMSNDPGYDQQLENLARYRGFGGELPPPGDILSPDRFVRAAYFLKYLPESKNYEEAVAGAVLLARNVAVPPGAPYDDFSVYPTWWLSATDVTNRTYYFQTTTSPNLIWVELDQLDFAEGAATLRLDPHQIGLVGDVALQFQPATAPY